MINSQYARVGKIFPSSGNIEPNTTFTSTSGLEYSTGDQKSNSSNLSSQFIQKIK